MNTVYHFTDSLRLPWIIGSGELRPSLNQIGGFPIDFLWATTSAVGDRTCTSQIGAIKQLYRDGGIQMVRFSLPADAFLHWRQAVAQFPEWTPHHVAALEYSAQHFGETETGINNWRCRVTPLPIASATVEAKSYAGGRWVPIDDITKKIIVLSDVRNGRGVIIGERVYKSARQTSNLDEPGKYTPLGVVPLDDVKMVEAMGV